MKQLIVMRHAKSSRRDSQLADFDRPLNKRGKQDAPRVANALMESNYLPHRVVSSAAARTTATARLVLEVWGDEIPFEHTERLYDASLLDYLQLMAELPDDCDSVLFIGHNPAIEHLLLHLCGQDVTMPTAAVAVIQVPISSWQQLDRETSGELIDVIRPRELPQLD